MHHLSLSVVISVICALAASAFAAPAGLPANMQGMMNMQAMQAMMACTQHLDMEAIEPMMQRGEQLAAEIDRLCKAGKQAQAEALARKEGMKIVNHPGFRQFHQCIQNVPDMQGMTDRIAAFDDDSVC